MVRNVVGGRNDLSTVETEKNVGRFAGNAPSCGCCPAHKAIVARDELELQKKLAILLHSARAESSHSRVAQSVEQPAVNRQVTGSSPVPGASTGSQTDATLQLTQDPARSTSRGFCFWARNVGLLRAPGGGRSLPRLRANCVGGPGGQFPGETWPRSLKVSPAKRTCG